MLPVTVFVCSFSVAAFAGLASLLRSGRPPTPLAVCNAMLNSGLLGLGISLLWYTRYVDNVYFLIGVCLVAGLGGMATVDVAITWLHRKLFSQDGNVKYVEPDSKGTE